MTPFKMTYLAFKITGINQSIQLILEKKTIQ